MQLLKNVSSQVFLFSERVTYNSFTAIGLLKIFAIKMLNDPDIKDDNIKVNINMHAKIVKNKNDKLSELFHCDGVLKNKIDAIMAMSIHAIFAGVIKLKPKQLQELDPEIYSKML